MDENKKSYIFDKPRNVKALIYALYAVCAVLFVLDFIVHRHVEHRWESWPGFYAIYGFVCCTFLVLAATAMRKVVQRKEDYYDD